MVRIFHIFLSSCSLSSFIFFCVFIFKINIHCQNDLFSIKIDSVLATKNYDSAIILLKELSFRKKSEKNNDKFDVSLKLAETYVLNNEIDKAVTLLLEDLGEIENGNLIDYYIKHSSFLGKLFEKEQNFERALFYLNSGLNEAVKIGDTLNLLKSYLDIGRIYYAMDSIDESKFYFNKIIDSTYSKYDNELFDKAYNNLGVIASDEKDYKKAENFGKKVLELRRKKNNSVNIAIALINLSAIYYEKGDYLKARENYIEAFKLVERLNDAKSIRVKESALFNLAYSNEMLGDFKMAYKYLEEASDLKDSLTEASIAQNISEVEARFNVEKQARIAEEEKSKREKAQLRTQVTFYGAAFAFLTLLILSYIFYRNYRLKQQNKLEQVENESQTKIINATVDAKEKERKAIAETLHDSVSALLSSANLHLQATKAQLKEKSPQEITKAQTIVNEASVKIRDLSHELISSVLLKFGLAFAVHDMCQKYSNSELSLHSDDDGIKRYDQDFEIKMHNIIEELVNNIIKHSKASNATIMLAHRENNMLSVRISDDGVGFDPKEAKRKDGLGLSHIGARIKVMKGIFNIISSKQNGTNIFISVPIQYKEKIA